MLEASSVGGKCAILPKDSMHDQILPSSPELLRAHCPRTLVPQQHQVSLALVSVCSRCLASRVLCASNSGFAARRSVPASKYNSALKGCHWRYRCDERGCVSFYSHETVVQRTAAFKHPAVVCFVHSRGASSYEALIYEWWMKRGSKRSGRLRLNLNHVSSSP